MRLLALVRLVRLPGHRVLRAPIATRALTLQHRYRLVNRTRYAVAPGWGQPLGDCMGLLRPQRCAALARLGVSRIGVVSKDESHGVRRVRNR